MLALFEKLTRNRYLLILDIIFSFLAFLGTNAFMDYSIGWKNLFLVFVSLNPDDWLFFAFTIVVYLFVLVMTNNHKVMWAFAGTKNYCNLLLSLFISALVSCSVSLIVVGERFTFLFNASIIIWIMLSRMYVRALYRILKMRKHKNASSTMVNVLIVGAGSAATLLLHDLTTNANSPIYYNVIGFVDKDRAKIGSYIEDVKVLGDIDAIPEVCEKFAVQEIFIAIPSLKSAAQADIINICSKTECRLKIMTHVENSLKEKDLKPITRDVQIEDLLARDTVVLDNSAIAKDITDKVVLVTGGGGSIGSELCRQIAKFNPKQLVVFDIYENNAYELQMELKDLFPDLNVDVIIGSVRDTRRLNSLFSAYSPHIVFHAAAHKHVPLMEGSPGEAIKNNIFGTYNVAKCADKYGVSKFVMISTDKAVNPTNVMGATKRVCEMIVQAMAKESNTRFVAVRFGNVLGSNGSVIPLFKRQIAHGGPIKVTHKEITRFFMTIPEAAQLVIQAAATANGGEIFVLDMGSPVKIYDLAVNLIKLSGYRPEIDIPIEITGLRPGEKLYEELLMSEEGLKDTSHEKIFIGRPSDFTMEEVEQKLDILREAVQTCNPDKIKEAIGKVVPTYHRTDNNKI
ncbi:MAG: nucleoside-diphosphate sugar epimerase/dehydratase [Bacillota bacterium]|nr:nucleoside-diphosphate sugar epimerase/dehydratase [Bacillota bacterium]